MLFCLGKATSLQGRPNSLPTHFLVKPQKTQRQAHLYSLYLQLCNTAVLLQHSLCVHPQGAPKAPCSKVLVSQMGMQHLNKPPSQVSGCKSSSMQHWQQL